MSKLDAMLKSYVGTSKFPQLEEVYNTVVTASLKSKVEEFLKDIEKKTTQEIKQFVERVQGDVMVQNVDEKVNGQSVSPQRTSLTQKALQVVNYVIQTTIVQEMVRHDVFRTEWMISPDELEKKYADKFSNVLAEDDPDVARKHQQWKDLKRTAKTTPDVRDSIRDLEQTEQLQKYLLWKDKKKIARKASTDPVERQRIMDEEHQSEMQQLLIDRNILVTTLPVIPAEGNKERLLRIIGMQGAFPVVYVTGGDPTPALRRRIVLCECEGRITAKNRKRMTPQGAMGSMLPMFGMPLPYNPQGMSPILLPDGNWMMQHPSMASMMPSEGTMMKMESQYQTQESTSSSDTGQYPSGPHQQPLPSPALKKFKSEEGIQDEALESIAATLLSLKSCGDESSSQSSSSRASSPPLGPGQASIVPRFLPSMNGMYAAPPGGSASEPLLKSAMYYPQHPQMCFIAGNAAGYGNTGRVMYYATSPTSYGSNYIVYDSNFPAPAGDFAQPFGTVPQPFPGFTQQ